MHLPEDDRPDFHLILDEAHDFSSEAVPNLLSQARHYGVTVTLATQYLSALPERTRAALLTNPAVLAVFRVADADAELLASQFNRAQQDFNPDRLMDLARGQAMVRVAGRDAWFREMPDAPVRYGTAELMRQQSRRHYGTDRRKAEAWINKQLRPSDVEGADNGRKFG
jgi:DNA helicase HerA-like ATPase